MNEEILFYRILERPAGERRAFLEQECGGDSALRRRVEILLQAHENPGSFLAEPAAVWTVDRLTDVGQGSGFSGDLRYCITQASDGDRVTFDNGLTGTIELTGELPHLTHSIAIEGPTSSQSGATPAAITASSPLGAAPPSSCPA